ncbi:MAG: MFS transporter [Actinobacteria bacterium]|nr:MFS transporter [Actinomycetota bacterium]
MSSLAIPNYRLYFYGQLVSMAGTWMQSVAQAVLVLHLTGSGSMLGLTIGARFAPMFLLGPFGGVVADRVDKRRVLLVTQFLSGVLALMFGLLTTVGAMRIWVVFVLAVVLGLVNVFDVPARQAFIPELVPPTELRNAVTLNSVTANLARVFGAALGGAIAAALGVALCFDVNAASYLAVLLTLLLMNTAQITAAPRRARDRGELRAGFAYVASRPELFVPLIMIAVVGTLAWEFQVSLPLIATSTFHGNVATYGLMAAVMGAGAVVGGLISAGRRSNSMTSLSFAALGWGTAITAAGVAPTEALEFVALVFVGYGSITFNSLAKTTLQLAARPDMRGRVMSLWSLAWMGSTPIGGPIVGFVAASLGARWGLLIGGVPTVLVGLAAWPVLARVRPTEVVGGSRPRPGLRSGSSVPVAGRTAAE